MAEVQLGIREVIELLNIMGHHIEYRENISSNKNRFYITYIDGTKYSCDSKYQPDARKHLKDVIGGVINGTKESNK